MRAGARAGNITTLFSPADHIGRKRPLAVALLALLLCAAGCSSTFTTLSSQQRFAQLRVTSQTPGAEVLLNGKNAGYTPLLLRIPYTARTERVSSGKRKTGWWVLAGGLLATAAGGVGAGHGGHLVAQSPAGEVDGGGVALVVLGSSMALFGLVTSWIGFSAVLTSQAVVERDLVQPARVTVGAVLPQGHRRSQRMSLSPRWPRPRVAETSRLHFFDGRLQRRPCRLRLTATAGPVQVLLRLPKGPPVSLGQTPLELSCKVRLRTPLVGLYDRAGEPRFSSRHSITVSGQGAGSSRTGQRLKLPLLLVSGTKRQQRTMLLDASRAWNLPAMQAAVDTGEIQVSYGQLQGTE